MIHKEWLGNEELINKILKRLHIDKANKPSDVFTAMRYILIYKYVLGLTVEDSIGRLYLEHNIDITREKYYRILKKLMHLIETKCKDII